MVAVMSNPATAAKKPPPTKFEAIVLKVDGATVIVNAPVEKHFNQQTVKTDAKTQITVNGKSAALTDLKAGDRVIVSPPGGTAKQIEQKAPRNTRPPEAGQVEGAVVSVSGSQLVLRSATSSGEIADMKTPVSEKASVSIDGKPGKLTDLKPGEYVMAVFFSGDLRRIVVTAPQP